MNCNYCSGKVKQKHTLIQKRNPINTSYSWFKAFSDQSTIDLVEKIIYQCKECQRFLSDSDVYRK